MSRSGRPSATTRTTAHQLDAAYAQIPDAGCKGLCQDSCHSLGMARVEQRRIRQATAVRLPLVHAGGPCPALGADGRCGVYEVRPLVCRLFAAVDDPLLVCEHGCTPQGGPLPAAEGSRLMRDVRALDGDR